MRIRSVKLENFRCFSEAELDLSADITAIYGRNGVGKTALFEAIEVGLVGSLSRFDSDSDALNCLDRVFSDSPFKIKIQFKNDGQDWIEVVRQRTTRGAKLVVKSSRNHTDHRGFIYEFIVDQKYSHPRREVHTIADLFTSSILLSQDSIRRFIEDSAGNRARIFSAMAGSAFLQRCCEKAQQVNQEALAREKRIQTKIRDLSEKLTSLRSSIMENEGRIMSLGFESGNATTFPELCASLKDLGIMTNTPLNERIEDEEFAARLVGICDEKVLAHEEEINKLSELQVLAASYVEWREKHSQKTQELIDIKTNLAGFTSRQESIGFELAKAEEEIIVLDRDIAYTSEKLHQIERLVELLRYRDELNSKRGHSFARAASIQKSLEESRVNLEGRQKTVRSLESEYSRAQVMIEHTANKIERVKELISQYQEFEVAETQIAGLDLRIRELSEQKADTTRRMVSLERESADLKTRLTEQNKLITDLQRSLEHYTALLTQLRSYTNSEECPLCGHRHSSTQALQNAITYRLESVPKELEEALYVRNQYTKRLSEVDAELRTARICASKHQELLESLTKNYSDVNSFIQSFKVRVQSTGMELRLASMEEYASSLEALQTAHKQECSRLESALRNEQVGVAQESALVDSLTRELDESMSTLHAIDSSLNCTEQETSELVKAGINEDSEDFNELRLHLQAQRSSLVISKQALEALALELDLILKKRQRDERLLKEYESESAALESRISEFQRRCKELQVSCSEDTIKGVLDKALTEQNKLKHVAKLAKAYERSCRFHTITQRLEGLRQEHDALYEDFTRLGREAEALRKAAQRASDWTRPLSNRLNGLVTSRISRHQPEIVRLFKAMIPFPFLFEDITLSNSEYGVTLGLVFRNQKEVKGEPRLYLSNAQSNVLGLSIFLSFALSQQWSRLQTLLLDDPVQHLDDLDALAFLDNLRAIADGKLGSPKQIIVSTCDQDFYLLMLRKFASLRGTGLTFRGFSILDRGDEGPLINDDTSEVCKVTPMDSYQR